MRKGVTHEELERAIAEAERVAGKYVVRCAITEDGVTDFEYANFGPGDTYVINVWNCRATLCRQRGHFDLEPVELAGLSAEEVAAVEDWLYDNVDAQGSITVSGIYPIVVEPPDAVAKALWTLEVDQNVDQN